MTEQQQQPVPVGYPPATYTPVNLVPTAFTTDEDPDDPKFLKLRKLAVRSCYAVIAVSIILICIAYVYAFVNACFLCSEFDAYIIFILLYTTHSRTILLIRGILKKVKVKQNTLPPRQYS